MGQKVINQVVNDIDMLISDIGSTDSVHSSASLDLSEIKKQPPLLLIEINHKKSSATSEESKSTVTLDHVGQMIAGQCEPFFANSAPLQQLFRLIFCDLPQSLIFLNVFDSPSDTIFRTLVNQCLLIPSIEEFAASISCHISQTPNSDFCVVQSVAYEVLSTFASPYFEQQQQQQQQREGPGEEEEAENENRGDKARVFHSIGPLTTHVQTFIRSFMVLLTQMKIETTRNILQPNIPINSFYKRLCELFWQSFILPLKSSSPPIGVISHSQSSIDQLLGEVNGSILSIQQHLIRKREFLKKWINNHFDPDASSPKSQILKPLELALLSFKQRHEVSETSTFFLLVEKILHFEKSVDDWQTGGKATQLLEELKHRTQTFGLLSERMLIDSQMQTWSSKKTTPSPTTKDCESLQKTVLALENGLRCHQQERLCRLYFQHTPAYTMCFSSVATQRNLAMAESQRLKAIRIQAKVVELLINRLNEETQSLSGQLRIFANLIKLVKVNNQPLPKLSEFSFEKLQSSKRLSQLAAHIHTQLALLEELTSCTHDSARIDMFLNKTSSFVEDNLNFLLKEDSDRISSDCNTYLHPSAKERSSSAPSTSGLDFGKTIVRQVWEKLKGKDFDAENLTVESQVDLIIKQAIHPDNLSQMYEGWTSWI